MPSGRVTPPGRHELMRLFGIRLGALAVEKAHRTHRQPPWTRDVGVSSDSPCVGIGGLSGDWAAMRR
jgi:hypothetical protein